MRPIAAFKRYIIRQAEQRSRPAGPRRLIDFAIAVTAFGALAMIVASVALDSPGLGLELGSRLVFAVCVLVAARAWVRA